MIGLLAACVLGTALPVRAILNSDTSLRLRTETEILGVLQFELARTGWSWAGVVASDTPSEARIRWPDGEGTVRANVSQDGNAVTYKVDASVAREVGYESTHVRLSLDRGWAGGEYLVDQAPRPFPAEHDILHLYDGPLTVFSASRGDRSIRVSADAPLRVLVQDSRRWGGGFDIRFGIPDTPGTWRPGQVRSFNLTISTGGPMETSVSQPITFGASADWIPLEAIMDVQPGSALDWSPRRVVPAGRNGWLQINNEGHFVFERRPNQRVKFAGVNLCFSSTVPTKEEARRLAVRLRRMGYNTIRFHHYDVELTGRWDRPDGRPSTELDPAAMDRFDYLFAQLKNQGLYIKIDLFSLRQFSPDEIMPGTVAMDEFKALLLVHERSRENWWAFTRNLLNHRNPYTGLAYKDDPALAWICPVNENNAGSATRSLSPASRRLWDEAFARAGGTGPWTFETDEGARFAARLHLETYQWMRDRIRSTGTRALLTDLNGWHDQTALKAVRRELDFVDNHNYWDHPAFLGTDWGLPSRGASGGGMATVAWGGGLPNMALSRIFGKPFTCSEFNFSNPNPFRAEGGLFLGALAARQDWDAVWRFAWSHDIANVNNPSPTNYFDLQADPLMLATDRAVVALFLREHLAPAKEARPWKLTPETMSASGYNRPVSRGVFDYLVGTSFTEGEELVGPLEPKPDSPVQIDDRRGVLTVNSHRTVGLFAAPGEAHLVGPLSARFQKHRGALWVSSLDGLPVWRSRRMLVTHLTDLQNTGMRYASEERDVLLAWGTVPHLVADGQSQVRLAVSNPRRLRVWRLDVSGRRIASVPTTTQSRALTDLNPSPVRGEQAANPWPADRFLEFQTSVRGPSGATLYYEIAER